MVTCKAAVRAAMLEFCRDWFEHRNVEETVRDLEPNVCFVGTSQEELAQGAEAVSDHMRQDIQEMPEPFTCGFSDP